MTLTRVDFRLPTLRAFRLTSARRAQRLTAAFDRFQVQEAAACRGSLEQASRPARFVPLLDLLQMKKGQFVLSAVQRALRVDERVQVQDQTRADRQFDRDAPADYGGKIANAFDLAETIEQPPVRPKIDVLESPRIIRSDAKRQTLRRLAMHWMQIRHRRFQADQIFFSQRQANIDVARHQRDSMKDSRQADDDVLDVRAVEPLKDLAQLVHRHGIVRLPASGPGPGRARSPAVAAMGSVASSPLTTKDQSLPILVRTRRWLSGFLRIPSMN